MASPFDSAWLKWGQAVVHAQALDREVLAAMQEIQSQQPYASSTEYDPKRHCVALKLDAVDPLPVRLGLLLGDAANNFRSSLDHLAWALVTTRPKRRPTGKEWGHIYFPMQKTRKDFYAHLLPKHLLLERDTEIIRRFQPFWNRPRSRPHSKSKIHRHCLAVLPDLNRDDKHKFIRPVWAWPTGGQFFVSDAPVDCTITRIPQRARGIVLETGAEVQRVYVKKTGPNPDVYMEAHLSVEPTLDGRVTLSSWLTETTWHVRDLLLRFAQPPEEILTLGIVPAK